MIDGGSSLFPSSSITILLVTSTFPPVTWWKCSRMAHGWKVWRWGIAFVLVSCYHSTTYRRYNNLSVSLVRTERSLKHYLFLVCNLFFLFFLCVYVSLNYHIQNLLCLFFPLSRFFCSALFIFSWMLSNKFGKGCLVVYKKKI